MKPLRQIAAVAAVALGLSGTLAACGRGTAANDQVAAAPGAPLPGPAASVARALASADPSKTGPAYTEELVQNPALFEKQKELCHGQGAALQPSRELEIPCADWDAARSKLQEKEYDEQTHVKNTDSL